MKVMVVEDYDDTRAMLRTMLEIRGCDVVEAVNGREAVLFALNNELDLILMDLNLPVMSGYEATEQISALPRTKHVPIVAVSAQCSDHRRQRALDSGCLECLDKPIDLSVIDQVLHRYAAN